MSNACLSIGVVLSGTGSDGSMGVQAIKKMGGTVIVQDKKTAEFFGMPDAAIQAAHAAFILPLDEIASALATLVMKGDVTCNRTTVRAEMAMAPSC